MKRELTKRESAKRLLLLPGVGDIYWVAVMLQDFIRKELGGIPPEVWIWDFDDRRRSIEFVERIPFVKVGGYFTAPNNGFNGGVFHESYMSDGRTIFPDFLGFDYYISANGALRNGRSVPEAFPDYEVDWHFPLTQTAGEIRAEEEYRERWPDGFIMGHFSEFGMFRNWVGAWQPHRCQEFVWAVQKLTGLPVVLTGSAWDKPFADRLAGISGAQNICGDTDFDHFMAILRGCSGSVGWCGGNTIMASVLGRPTAMGWSVYFHDRRFFLNAVAPSELYYPFTVERVTPEEAALAFAAVFEKSKKGG